VFNKVYPLIALFNSSISLYILLINLLYLVHSCNNTVFIDSSYDVLYFNDNNSKSKSLGILCWIENAFSSYISSWDFPDLLEPVLGCISNIFCNNSFDIFWFVDISAFACNPNNSGVIKSKLLYI